MAREPFNKVWAENPDGTGPNTFQQPSDTRLEKGWVGGASGTAPPAGEENWWHNRVDVAMQQIERFGVMDYHAETVYGIGGRARGSDGKFYLSVVTPNEGNDPTLDDGSNWVEELGPGQNIAVFDTAGVTNWTVPTILQLGIRKAHVTVIGGGGGASRMAPAIGNGGAGGGVSVGVVDLTGVASVNVTVGAKGIGRTSTNGAGTSGGTSSFEAYLSATGGQGGAAVNGRASGGSGSGGDINIDGERSNSSAGGGDGGGSIFGGRGSNGAGSGTVGGAATAPGGGGAGGENADAGDGADGIVIVRW